MLKQKKVQKERERCTQIVLDNCILWRHLGEITSNSRVDNHWKSERPKYEPNYLDLPARVGPN